MPEGRTIPFYIDLYAMLPLYVVNNHGQFNHLILRTLRDMDLETTMISNETPPAEVARGCRGIILGGGPTLDRIGVAPAYLTLASRSSASVLDCTSWRRPGGRSPPGGEWGIRCGRGRYPRAE
jgi:GMP synthase - Glutamine amidotransferase domain